MTPGGQSILARPRASKLRACALYFGGMSSRATVGMWRLRRQCAVNSTRMRQPPDATSKRLISMSVPVASQPPSAMTVLSRDVRQKWRHGRHVWISRMRINVTKPADKPFRRDVPLRVSSALASVSVREERLQPPDVRTLTTPIFSAWPGSRIFAIARAATTNVPRSRAVAHDESSRCNHERVPCY